LTSDDKSGEPLEKFVAQDDGQISLASHRAACL
jgi:hypothetical protein